MDITYLGHSSFKLKGKTASVICDPFDPKEVGLKFTANEADIVTSSHQHLDHHNLEAVKGAKKVIDGPGEYEISGISIIGINSYHDNKKGEEMGRNIIFIFEIDNLRIAHLGDLGYVLTEKEAEELGEIDILMLPVGGVHSLNSEQAAEIVRLVEPILVIPMHFKVEGINLEAFGKLDPVETFLKEVELPVEKLPKLSVKKELLGEETKVIILEKH